MDAIYNDGSGDLCGVVKIAGTELTFNDQQQFESVDENVLQIMQHYNKMWVPTINHFITYGCKAYHNGFRMNEQQQCLFDKDYLIIGTKRNLKLL